MSGVKTLWKMVFVSKDHKTKVRTTTFFWVGLETKINEKKD